MSPSRIGVAGDGSAWVANRAPGLQGSVVKVLNDGFIDRNGNGIVDTSTDRNSNGVIDPDELMAWDATMMVSLTMKKSLSPFLLVETRRIRQNCVLTVLLERLPSMQNDNIWVGIFNQRQYEVYDGKRASSSRQSQPQVPQRRFIDAQGFLWGATLVDNRIEKNRYAVQGHL